MIQLPIFFETLSTQQFPELLLCKKIMQLLFNQKIVPLPFASSLNELADISKSLAARNSAPAIFIVNTLGAEGILMALDQQMGETPALFLRRSLSHDKRVMNMLGDSSSCGTTSVLNGMKPRLAAVWGFGSKNADDVAALVAHSVSRFLQDGDFRHIERQNKFAITAFPVAN
ncbi:MAG: hypothetical protein V1899_08125 [Planctomycetota bacterium]